jgi:hypothetical protein
VIFGSNSRSHTHIIQRLQGWFGNEALESLAVAFLYERRTGLAHMFPDDYRTLSDNLMSLIGTAVRSRSIYLHFNMHTDDLHTPLAQEWLG